MALARWLLRTGDTARSWVEPALALEALAGAGLGLRFRRERGLKASKSSKSSAGSGFGDTGEGLLLEACAFLPLLGGDSAGVGEGDRGLLLGVG